MQNNNIKSIYLSGLIFTIGLFGSIPSFSQSKLSASLATEEITIDGIANEASWNTAIWYNIDQTWIGSTLSQTDFTGRYKVLWDQNYLYIIAEITDDVLSDDYADPLTNWWDDDGIEIFIDENASKGNHQYNYNAFAYHVSTKYDVVDVGTDQKPHLYNDHISTVMTKKDNLYTWECKMKVFDDSFVYGSNNTPVTLSENKKIGFSIAYNDNDLGNSRENFMGSGVVPGSDKNVGYITADYFQELTLVKNVLAVEEGKTNIDINIYPNPAKDQLYISLSPSNWESIEIQNISGEQILKQEIKDNQHIKLDVSSLKSGVYLLHLKGDKVITKKIFID